MEMEILFAKNNAHFPANNALKLAVLNVKKVMCFKMVIASQICLAIHFALIVLEVQ